MNINYGTWLFIGTVASLLLTMGCQEEKTAEPEYFRHVGDTKFDPLQDDTNFNLCHDDMVLQYYNFSSAIQYNGEKYAIISAFDQKYHVETISGETGWFRVEEVDVEYKPTKFDNRIVTSLLDITKSLDGWKVGEYDKKTYDYYQYLTFKIKDAQLVQILP